MKKLTIVLLAIVLAACGAPPAAPTEQAVAPEPVVVTVVVEPTQVPAEPATAVPAEPATPVVVTVVVEPTQAPATAVPPTEAPTQSSDNTGDTTVMINNTLGKGVFTNMTVSDSHLTLRCSPREITFNITAPNSDIKDVMFYYRTADEKRQYPTEWRAFGKMVDNGGGNFTLTFSGEDVHPTMRLDGGWLDFQFVGLAKSGDVVDRSEKIESMVKYTFDCE